MKENIYYGRNRDKFEELSDSLSKLVDDLKGYEKNVSKKMNEKIIADLETMSNLCKVLGGVVEKDFNGLRNDVKSFLNNPKDIDKVMLMCVELKNQLWEL